MILCIQEHFLLDSGIGNAAILISNDCSVNPSDLSKMLVKKHEEKSKNSKFLNI